MILQYDEILIFQKIYISMSPNNDGSQWLWLVYKLLWNSPMIHWCHGDEWNDLIVPTLTTVKTVVVFEGEKF